MTCSRDSSAAGERHLQRFDQRLDFDHRAGLILATYVQPFAVDEHGDRTGHRRQHTRFGVDRVGGQARCLQRGDPFIHASTRRRRRPAYPDANRACRPRSACPRRPRPAVLRVRTARLARAWHRPSAATPARPMQHIGAGHEHDRSCGVRESSAASLSEPHETLPRRAPLPSTTNHSACGGAACDPPARGSRDGMQADN